MAVFACILLAGVLARLYGITFGLPYVYHPDEPTNIGVYLNILRDHDPNPHFFHYPSLFIYLNSFVSLVYQSIGVWLGEFHAFSDLPYPKMLGMGIGFTAHPSFFLVGRLLTALTGILTLPVMFWCGKIRNDEPAAGFVAMAFMSVSTLTVMENHYITPDSFVTLFALLTLLGALSLAKSGSTKAYVGAGIAAGLTISSKYNGAFILLPVVLAHFSRYGWAGVREWRIYLLAVLCAVTFFGTTPYSVLDFEKFREDLAFERLHYSTGHAGMEGDVVVYYLNLLWKNDGILPVLAFAGLVWGLAQRDAWTMIVGAFPVAYFLFVSTYVVRNERTALVALPFLYLLAADFLVQLWKRGTKGAAVTQPRLRDRVIVALALAACLALPILNTINGDRGLARADSRTTAVDWIRKNIPAGAQVAYEAYAPYIDPSGHHLHYVPILGEQTSAWYVENHIEYLVFSEEMYKRYTMAPDRYPIQAAQYRALFTQFHLVQRFRDGGYEVLIYRVG